MKTTKITSLLTAFAMFAGTAAMVPVMPESEIVASAVESTEAAYDNQTEMEEPTGDWCETEPADEYEDPTSNCEQFPTEIYEDPTGDCCETEAAEEYEDPTGNCEQFPTEIYEDPTGNCCEDDWYEEPEPEILQYGLLSYNVYDDHITIYSCNTSVKEVEIPAEINGLPVTGIEQWAFNNCKKLTSVDIPDSVTHIGGGAFENCVSLTFIEIPEGVESLGENTFACCINLVSITLPKSINHFGVCTFIGCTALANIYYAGTKVEWDEISFYDYGNEVLLNAEIHYASDNKPAVISGNINGDASIDATDAALLLSAAAAAGAGGESGLTAEQIKAADLDGNGSFDASDASLILMYAAYSGAGGELEITEYLAQL